MRWIFLILMFPAVALAEYSDRDLEVDQALVFITRSFESDLGWNVTLPPTEFLTDTDLERLTEAVINYEEE